MLRFLFGQPRRADRGELLDAYRQIDAIRLRLAEWNRGHPRFAAKFSRWDVWAMGLRYALDELEQSLYCSRQFRARVTQTEEAAMSAEEADDYHRYLYFFKNGVIRVFSVLDKFGEFLNDALELHTDRVKERFSYYTVLRQLALRHEEELAALSHRLHEIKAEYKEPMIALRTLRNFEVHSINLEMLDDLNHRQHRIGSKSHVEDLDTETAELASGYAMVCRTLTEGIGSCRKIMEARYG